MYVLKRTDQHGGYVTQPGDPSSYTHNLARARTFASREDAERQRCKENEVVLTVESQLQRPGPG